MIILTRYPLLGIIFVITHPVLGYILPAPSHILVLEFRHPQPKVREMLKTIARSDSFQQFFLGQVESP